MIKTTEGFKREFTRIAEEMFDTPAEKLNDTDQFAVLTHLVHHEAALRREAFTDHSAPVGKKVY